MNFWDVHGLFFILFLAFLPRFTMFVTGIFFAFGGFFFWMGWLFAPRLTVAILATQYYWSSNPLLCVITWIWALGGESTEKKVVHKKSQRLLNR